MLTYFTRNCNHFAQKVKGAAALVKNEKKGGEAPAEPYIGRAFGSAGAYAIPGICNGSTFVNKRLEGSIAALRHGQFGVTGTAADDRPDQFRDVRRRVGPCQLTHRFRHPISQRLVGQQWAKHGRQAIV
jgi:hypothetical protein